MIEIPLRGKAGQGLPLAIVDDEHTWAEEFPFYPNYDPRGRLSGARFIPSQSQRAQGVKSFYLHVRVMEVNLGRPLSADEKVDHRDLNVLNDLNSNLHVVSHSLNNAHTPLQRNSTSGLKGVCWDKKAGKWRASVRVNGKHLLLGYFEDPKDAARAYDEKAMYHFGECALTNEQLGLIGG